MQKVNHGELKGGTKYTKRELGSWGKLVHATSFIMVRAEDMKSTTQL